MQTTATLTSIFHSSLERVFKTPMLCDIAKIHTGYGLTPRVTHCTEDARWGQPGGSRKIFMAKNLAFGGGESSLDTVLERRENEYWKIEISDFKSWAMGFYKFQGEWVTSPLPDGSVGVIYRYTMFSSSRVFYPFHWLFTKLIWRSYMKNVMKNIHTLVEQEAPYLYD